jgi:hypothetical protein
VPSCKTPAAAERAKQSASVKWIIELLSVGAGADRAARRFRANIFFQLCNGNAETDQRALLCVRCSAGILGGETCEIIHSIDPSTFSKDSAHETTHNISPPNVVHFGS